MRYKPINPELFVRNRKKLTGKLLPNSLAIVQSNDEMPSKGDQFYLFCQNPDMFYLTGIDQENCILTLCPNHPEKKFREILFIPRVDEKTTRWLGEKLNPEQATAVSGIGIIKWLDDFEQILNQLVYTSDHIYLNTNEYPKFSTPIAYKDLRFIDEMKKKYPLHEYLRLAPLLQELRIRKEPEEIELITTACNITSDAFHRVLQFVKPGVAEYEVEAEITHEFIRQRATGHAYLPIVASGSNSCILHYTQNNRECKAGDLLLMDFGAEYAHYAADTTRVIPVNGKFTTRQRQVYDAVLRVMRYAETLLVPGNTYQKYHREVCRCMEHELIELGLLSESEVKNETDDIEIEKKALFKYYMHGTSHYVGLDVHDVGSRYCPFEPGMVFSCEPGIYIPEENIGIRLEDIFLITENRPKNLFFNHPIEPNEIEALMRKRSNLKI